MVSGVFTCMEAIGVTVSVPGEDVSDHGFDRAFVASSYQSLRRFAAVVGSPDIDPDDLVQEAFVRTLRTHRLDELDDPSAYLRRVILNVARSQRRRFGLARRAISVLEASTPVAANPTYPSDVAELYRLGPKQRAVMFLHDIEGFSFEEVAEMLEMSPSAARMSASRGRRRLRRLLEEEADQ